MGEFKFMTKNTKNTTNNPQVKAETINPVSPVAGLDLVELIKLQEQSKALQAQIEAKRAEQLEPLLKLKGELEAKLEEIDNTLRALGVLRQGRPVGSRNKPKNETVTPVAPINPEVAQTLSILKDVGTPENGVNIETMPTAQPVAAVA